MLSGFRLSLLISVVLLFIAAPTLAAPRSVTLAWDANTEPDLAGYKIYWSRYSQMYDKAGSQIQDVPGQTVTQTTVQNLADGLWYFVATAYDNLGNESNYSNEVYDDGNIPPATPGGFSIRSKIIVP